MSVSRCTKASTLPSGEICGSLTRFRRTRSSAVKGAAALALAAAINVRLHRISLVARHSIGGMGALFAVGIVAAILVRAAALVSDFARRMGPGLLLGGLQPLLQRRILEHAGHVPARRR